MTGAYDPKTSLRHYPSIPMNRFGLTPYGDPAYRLVFGPSRRYLCIDDSGSARFPVKYHVGNNWILERWLSATEFHAPGRANWEQFHAHVLGPWPERGEYELVHVFLEAPPTSSQVEKIITWIKYGRERFSFAEHLAHQRDEAMREQAQKQVVADDILRSRLPAFGVRAMSSRLVRRRSRDEDRELRSAEELGLPTTPGPRVIAPAAA